MTAADTIYAIDKVSGEAVLDWLSAHWPREWPVPLVMEDIPDEEPARVIDDEPETNGRSTPNKTELIRAAVDAGYEKPAHGVKHIKEKYGVDIDSKYFSIVKGKMGKGEEKTASTPVASVPRKAAAPSAPAASAGAVPASLLDDLVQLRQIKDRYGDDFQKIVDAIG